MSFLLSMLSGCSTSSAAPGLPSPLLNPAAAASILAQQQNSRIVPGMNGLTGPPPPPPPFGSSTAPRLSAAPVVGSGPAPPRLGGGGRLSQIAASQPITCNCGTVFPNLEILEKHMAKAHPENTNLVSANDASERPRNCGSHSEKEADGRVIYLRFNSHSASGLDFLCT